MESVETTLEALEQLRLRADHRERNHTVSGQATAAIGEQPDWPTRLKACRLVAATAAAMVPEIGGQPDRRTLRIVA
jgi:hypothetical protein